MTFDPAIIWPALFSTLLGVVVTWFWRGRTAAVSHKAALAQAVTDLAKQRDAERDASIAERADLRAHIQVLEASMKPVNEAFMAVLVKGLTHPKYPEMDALLAKISTGTLTAHDEETLCAGLQERIANPGKFTSQVELDMAVILPTLLRLIEAERALGVMPGLSVLNGAMFTSIKEMHKDVKDHHDWELNRAVLTDDRK